MDEKPAKKCGQNEFSRVSFIWNSDLTIGHLSGWPLSWGCRKASPTCRLTNGSMLASPRGGGWNGSEVGTGIGLAGRGREFGR